MPTNPASPNSSAAVDRLTLSVESPRGTEPSKACVCAPCCFEAETSSYNLVCGCMPME